MTTATAMTIDPDAIPIVDIGPLRDGSDPKGVAQALHAAARKYPGVFKRLEWWDRNEGPLPNPDVQYPKTPRAAAFACTNQTCSLPVFESDKVAAMVERLLTPPQ